MIAKRIIAFLIDYAIILLYIIILWGFTELLAHLFAFPLNVDNPVKGEVIGFITLTLPVILYFSFSEHSQYAGTFGKRKYGLKVLSRKKSTATFAQLLWRNILKFLPWELAHFLVFHLVEFQRMHKEPPGWVITGLIFAQLLALVYFLCMVFNKQHRSIYETLSNTMVVAENG